MRHKCKTLQYLVILLAVEFFIIMFFEDRLSCRHSNQNKERTGHVVNDFHHTYSNTWPNIKSEQTKSVFFTPGDTYPSQDQGASTVHYLWCDRKFFRFENYLSIMSVIKIINPTKIVFHYTNLPVTDSFEYHTWFKELKETVPNLVLHNLGVGHVCYNSRIGKLKTAWQYIEDKGGIYVGENTLLTTVRSSFQQKDLAFSIPRTHVLAAFEGVLYTKRRRQGEDGLNVINKAVSHHNLRCCSVKHYETNENMCSCVIVQENLYPKDIWKLSTNFGNLTRWITYGQTEIIQQKPDFTNLAPRISHYIWCGERNLEFSHYLSVLSTLYVAGMDRIFFHGDFEPKGNLWQKLKVEENVAFIISDHPGTVFGQEITVPAHCGDILRLHVLLKYGGISQDPDVFWVNHVTDEMFAYDSVISFDWPNIGEWPETINFGTVIAKRNSKYLQKLLMSYKDYRDSDWGYNAILMPYRVMEKNPSMAFANRHLHVICCLSKCHPSWLPFYKENPGKERDHPFNWRNETLAIHITLPKPQEQFKDFETLKRSEGMFAEVGIYILQKSGKLSSRSMLPEVGIESKPKMLSSV